MQFIDLKAQYNVLKEKIDSNISKVLLTGAYIGGPAVTELEEKLADYVGVKHCITCANGTDALELVLLAWGIGPGDAVFVPSFTFMSTAEVVAYRGAVPVFVDIDERTFNMDAASLEEAIAAVREEGTLTPAAVIPVDLFGLPANYPAIEAIAHKNSLKILEDGAQGFGGSINGKVACSFGDAATTSFFPAKPLGCYGDGGAIFTNDDKLNEVLRSLCVHGKGAEKYDNVRVGRNSRLDTLQAAVLLPKLDAFASYELDARNAAAAYYSENIQGSFKTPVVPEGFISSWAQYTLLFDNETDRNLAKVRLAAEGVPAMVYYPKPLHQQLAFVGSNLREYVELSVSESVSKRVLSLPMHPYLTVEAMEKVVSALA